MADTIDLHDLPEAEAKLVQAFVEFLKERLKRETGKPTTAEAGETRKGQEANGFATWQLGVKGRLTRREVYDYL